MKTRFNAAGDAQRKHDHEQQDPTPSSARQ